MQSQNTNPYDDVNFRTNLSLEACLERLEVYRERAHRFGERRMMAVTIEPIIKNEIYKIRLYQGFSSLELELQANDGGCIITGQVQYNWFTPVIIALFVFGFYWFSSSIAVTFDNGFFVLSILLGGSFLFYWLFTMGMAGELKLKLREILEGTG